MMFRPFLSDNGNVKTNVHKMQTSKKYIHTLFWEPKQTHVLEQNNDSNNNDKKMKDFTWFIVRLNGCSWDIDAAQFNLRRKDFPLLMARDY